MEHSNKIFIKDQDNSAFNYLKDKYLVNIDIYSKIADIIYEASLVSAGRLGEEYGVKINNDLIHFFYDLYLVLSSKLFTLKSNIDISAIIDGMHIKYFGQPSTRNIVTQIQLWAEKEKCYLNSFLNSIKGEDFVRLWTMFAFSCISDEPVGMTESLELSEILISIIQIILPKIEDRVKIIIVE